MLWSVTDIVRDDIAVKQDFKDQLRRSKDGWYETRSMRKNNSTALQKNKLGSFGRLKNLLWKLQRNQEVSESYDQIIHEKLAEGVVE